MKSLFLRQLLQHLGDFAKHYIPMAVAVGVVDFLEIIHINKDSAEGTLSALVFHPVLHIFIQPLPVVNAGQVIRVDVLILNVQEDDQDGQGHAVS